MTRSITAAGRRAMGAAGQRNKNAGLLGQPGSHTQRRHPDWVLHRVAQCRESGRSIDQYEAAETFAGQWWAAQARYLGYSRGFFTFERPPEGDR